MRSWHTGLAAVVTAAVIMVVGDAGASVITLGSGTSNAIGETDSNIKAVQGPLDSDFSDGDFATAMATLAGGGGVNPFVIDKHPAWASPIAGTHYINTRSDGAGQGATDAYMLTFTLPDVLSASLNLQFLADNLLNDIFVNGTKFDTSAGGFGSVTTNDFDIHSAVVIGTNRLFLRAVDVGGPGGFDFKATITFEERPHDPSVPAPAGVGLLGFVLALAGLARRRT
jgi:hypothetical protein